MSRAKKKRAGKRNTRSPHNAPLKGPAKPFPFEWLGFAVIGLLVIAALAVSWRKWPDPLVDFGRELYLPWQITQGAVLYRDMDALFGPLSQYFNALVFLILGPGFMNLVAVNLLIYSGILVLLYHIIRIGWGPSAAFVGSVVFVTVFSFNQFVGIGNYNFAAPYAHETTHGFFLILALVATWSAWLRNPRLRLAALAGLLWGLCLLLKVEVIFTATLVSLGAIVLKIISDRSRPTNIHPLKQFATFVVPAILPSTVATIGLSFSGNLPITEAWFLANSAVTGLLSHGDFVRDPAQADLLGLSNLPTNLISVTLSGSISVLIICLPAFILRRVERMPSIYTWISITLITILAVYVSLLVPWLELGKALPAWLIVAVICAALQYRSSLTARNIRYQTQWLLILAAGALLARMTLNPRIYHYGYFQAALAGVVMIVTAWKSIPDLFQLKNASKIAFLVALSIFMASGIFQLQKISTGIYSLKTQSYGTGVDQIYGFNLNIDPTTLLLEEARKQLISAPSFERLLVVPEGVMLNYLLKKKNPSFAYMFHPYWLKSIDRILKEISINPPDYVLVISRDMREHSIARFGESPAHGAQLISWIDWNCEPIWHLGGDPLDVDQRGASIYKHRGTPR